MGGFAEGALSTDLLDSAPSASPRFSPRKGNPDTRHSGYSWARAATRIEEMGIWTIERNGKHWRVMPPHVLPELPADNLPNDSGQSPHFRYKNWPPYFPPVALGRLNLKVEPSPGRHLRRLPLAEAHLHRGV